MLKSRTLIRRDGHGQAFAREEMGISTDTALRLGKVFGITPAFWLNLQSRYDLLTAEAKLAMDLANIEPIKVEAA